MKTFMVSGFFLLCMSCVLLLMYYFGYSVTTLCCACILLGIALSMLTDFFLFRFDRASKGNKKIEVVVDAATYERLQLMADKCKVSLSVFCSCCLEAVDPVALDEAGDRVMNEWLDGALEVAGDE